MCEVVPRVSRYALAGGIDVDGLAHLRARNMEMAILVDLAALGRSAVPDSHKRARTTQLRSHHDAIRSRRRCVDAGTLYREDQTHCLTGTCLWHGFSRTRRAWVSMRTGGGHVALSARSPRRPRTALLGSMGLGTSSFWASAPDESLQVLDDIAPAAQFGVDTSLAACTLLVLCSRPKLRSAAEQC